MAKHNWNELTVEDVIAAIHIFDVENPKHPEARSTFLVYNEKKYPAKHIRGMAYQVHYGRIISKDAFTGGQDTVRFFSRLGFETQYTPPGSNALSAQKEKINPVKQALSQQDKPPKKNAETRTNATSVKISISNKGVIEQKNALQLL